MQNRGLIITLIILLSIITIMLIGLLVSCLTGNFNIITFGRKKRSTNVVIDESYDIQEIRNIEILSDAGDITFEKSEDERIRIVAYGEHSNDCKTSLYNDKLKIDYSENYRLNFFGFNSYRNDIIVYIPDNYSEEIDIKSDYGNCSIIDLENATISVDLDCGNLILGKVKNLKVKCDLGNIEIGTILNKFDIETDCGNLVIENVEIMENSSIKSDLGDIEIKKINDIYIDAKVDLGHTEINGSNRSSNITLKIDSDCGNIEVGTT